MKERKRRSTKLAGTLLSDNIHHEMDGGKLVAAVYL